ncbi:hypothetical protein C8039_08325 [Halogeometricum sp. wsp3]|nr:hypothetical protein C8039_08325 [Halogeometricum sp. wsp3]
MVVDETVSWRNRSTTHFTVSCVIILYVSVHSHMSLSLGFCSRPRTTRSRLETGQDDVPSKNVADKHLNSTVARRPERW